MIRSGVLMLRVIVSAVRSFLEPVVPFGPLEGAVDDLLGVVDDGADELLRREDPLLDEDRAETLARAPGRGQRRRTAGA